MFIINDRNWQDVAGDGHKVTLPDLTEASFGWPGRQFDYGASPFIEAQSFEPFTDAEIKRRLAEQGPNTLIEFCKDQRDNHGMNTLHQNGTNYCWMYSTIRGIEIIRAKQNEPMVLLSPESAAGPITGWRNVGGYPEVALKYIRDNGCCRVSKTKGYTSFDYRSWDADWRDDCQNFKCAEFLEVPPTFRHVATLNVLGIPVIVGYNWWRHAVVAIGVVLLDSGELAQMIWNSHGPSSGENGFVVLSGSRKEPDMAIAPTAMVAGYPNATATLRTPGVTVGALAGSLAGVPPEAIVTTASVGEEHIDITLRASP